MCVACNYTIHRKHHNFVWSRDFAPALRRRPGETIHFEYRRGRRALQARLDFRRRGDTRLRPGQRLALDVSVRGQVLDLLLELQEETGLAYLFLSRAMAVTERMSHDVA